MILAIRSYRVLIILSLISLLLASSDSTYSQEIDWLRFRIPGVIEISIPPCIELQGGIYKEIKNAILQSGYYDLSKNEKSYMEKAYIFQQTGLNDFNAKACATYARVMIYFEIGPDYGVGPVITDRDFPKNDLLLLNNTCS
jgi:hypothetical protein